ncbi:putative wall-associated receptor kinase-like 16 [Cryptomeria japonica]|uniref:putative wall-associated receptor kinase-like 16 n=1 Tax=Cryptomeria japonica TaxID=3369 RepID=UPI0027DA37EB|nr:putative wall-associated receptor kinase-like 16 [Cryptomeria japonica]
METKGKSGQGMFANGRKGKSVYERGGGGARYSGVFARVTTAYASTGASTSGTARRPNEQPYRCLLSLPFAPAAQHLQSPENHLPWERRRQIAIETAEGIAYVHREASQPIFHRDIKPSNILLDDTFTPKVADFGISRLRPSDEMHLSTMFPSGTPGYVDPEFIRSNQLTEKSDDFSFGLVLVELLTGLKTVLSCHGEKYTLYDHFLSTINDGLLTNILDPKIVDEENQWQMENMAKLAKECLHKE